ncbi:MAG: outer membrane protein assembly factor BamE, partial [Aeromonas sp.]
MRMKHLIAAALTAITLSGCSLVYRIDIPQGNYVEQKQVDKLRQGMTREQVSFVLGTPMLRDGFDPNSWYYLYEFQPGHGELERKELTVTFTNEQLSSVTGDFPL